MGTINPTRPQTTRTDGAPERVGWEKMKDLRVCQL